MAQRSQKHLLRIGIIRGGKMAEDKLMRDQGPVTIGTDQKNTFVVPISNLPKRYTLFEFKGANYQLSFTDKMQGKVQHNSSMVGFDELKKQKKIKKSGDKFILPLTKESKGKIIVGEISVLFQFVEPPPEPAKPQIPALAKGGWIKSINWIFFSIFFGSFLLHSTLIVFFETRPPLRKLSLDQIEDRFSKLIMPNKPEPKKKPSDDGNKKKEGEGKKKKDEKKKDVKKEEPKKVSKKAKKKMSVEEKARAEAVRKAAIAEKVKGKGMLRILGALGDGSSGGALADVLSEGGGMADMDGAMQNIGMGGVAVADSAMATSKKGAVGGGKIAGIGKLGTKGGGTVNIKKKRAAKVSGAISMDEAPEVDGALVPGKITRVIRMRLGSVKACYERRLKANPKLRGKIVIGFTINTRGRVIETSVASNTMGDSKVAQCIMSHIKRWRFPKPEGGDVSIEFPFVFAPAG